MEKAIKLKEIKIMKEEIEIWKSLDFLGYSEYEISNFGRVKSLNYLRTKREEILKFGKAKNGYLQVLLCENKKQKCYKVHKLVALAFISNPENLPCINHKDENKENNHVSNLEFCTHKYNNNYGTRKERISEGNKGKKRTEESKQKIGDASKKPILQYTLDNVFIKEFDSATTADKDLKINQSSITKCCKGKLKTSGGYIWKYKI